MPEFIDHVKIHIASGKGGDGHVSFRREKYVANGGPDGGDGGKGGDVIFTVDPGRNTLSDFHYNGKYKAESGEEGGNKRCSGKSGADLILKVPEGTVVREADSGAVIADLSGDQKRVVLLKGGRGGTGNMHYATATMQAPQYAKPGQEAKELDVVLELKMIADVGLVGFPNVGKSTFLSKVSNAKPQVANYHFTTLTPSLGVVHLDDARDFVIADIPGLIEGASEGAGLGLEFLRHIERTNVIIHVVDAAGTEGRDPLDDIELINHELKKYKAAIAEKPQIIAANKIDMLPNGADSEIIHEMKRIYEPRGVKVFPTSTLTGAGLHKLLYDVSTLLSKINQTPLVFEQEFDPEAFTKSEKEGYTISYNRKENAYVIEGPRIEKMLGYTNLESEKGFAFFQQFLRDNGIIAELEKKGIREGDLIRIYGHGFEYYPDR